MEEVDNIIFQALHQLGIVFGEDVSTLRDFPDELVLIAAKKCLDTIVGEETVQISPKDTSQKIALANDIVSECKKIGFKGDLGYELLLYPNEVDLRRIFTFFIDKLPKESDKIFTPRDNFSLMMQNISQNISESMEQPWSPPYFNENTLEYGVFKGIKCRYLFPFNKIPFKAPNNGKNINEEFASYWKTNVSDGTFMKSEITTDMEAEAQAIMDKLIQSKSNISTLKMTSLLRKSDTEMSTQGNSRKHCVNPSMLSMKELAETLKSIEEEKENMINKIKTLHSKRNELSTEINAEKLKESVLREKKETHDLVCSLLPEYDTNVEKLKKIREKEVTKLTNLKNEIAARELEATKEQELNSEYIIKRDKYNAEINTLEGKKNKLSEELKRQANLKIQLKKDCEKRNIKKKFLKKRSAYTKRIMEIIGNVAKQKMEINRILSDTRVLQKEMNNLNGRLDRSFTVVDELVFKDAKKDEHARKTYKLVAYIHTGCGEIVNNVGEVGSMLREIRDLEKRVEAEKKKKIEENLQRVYSDLKYLQSKRDNHYNNK